MTLLILGSYCDPSFVLIESCWKLLKLLLSLVHKIIAVDLKTTWHFNSYSQKDLNIQPFEQSNCYFKDSRIFVLPGHSGQWLHSFSVSCLIFRGAVCGNCDYCALNLPIKVKSQSILYSLLSGGENSYHMVVSVEIHLVFPMWPCVYGWDQEFQFSLLSCVSRSSEKHLLRVNQPTER